MPASDPHGGSTPSGMSVDPTSLQRALALIEHGLLTLGKMAGGKQPRYRSTTSPEVDPSARYRFPDLGDDLSDVVSRLTRRAFADAVCWHAENQLINAGAAPHPVAIAMASLAAAGNIYMINEGLAGAAMSVERRLVGGLAALCGLPPTETVGLSTFGGTGTVLYAMKSAIAAAAPDASMHGVPDDLYIATTEDSHFCHAVCADWLGIGTNRLVTLPSGPDGRTSIPEARQLFDQVVSSGGRLAGILINGGTTYDHVIDDIAAMVGLVDELVADAGLSWRPHLHVDSVLGWAWLVVNTGIGQEVLRQFPTSTQACLRKQAARIASLRLADSWSVDFHKGVGACPVPSSFFVMSDGRMCYRLRKASKGATGQHQILQERAVDRITDLTLETSRSAAGVLAALAVMEGRGLQGLAEHLATVVDASVAFRERVATCSGLELLNPHALGYVTMFRMSREGAGKYGGGEDEDAYNERLFKYYQTKLREDPQLPEVSFSSKYRVPSSRRTVAAWKCYVVSPDTRRQHIEDLCQTLIDIKSGFDRAEQ